MMAEQKVPLLVSFLRRWCVPEPQTGSLPREIAYSQAWRTQPPMAPRNMNRLQRVTGYNVQ